MVVPSLLDWRSVLGDDTGLSADYLVRITLMHNSVFAYITIGILC